MTPRTVDVRAELDLIGDALRSAHDLSGRPLAARHAGAIAHDVENAARWLDQLAPHLDDTLRGTADHVHAALRRACSAADDSHETVRLTGWRAALAAQLGAVTGMRDRA